jgi:hypothetical protein
MFCIDRADIFDLTGMRRRKNGANNFTGLTIDDHQVKPYKFVLR